MKSFSIHALKPFEYCYLMCSPLLPPLYRMIRRELFQTLDSCPTSPAILDVGGRKSHYTIGLPASVTITDLPRITEVQRNLNLGITDHIKEKTRSRRSNVREIIYDDMTKTTLDQNSYDLIVSTEVLEHVAEDKKFVANVFRVLRPRGFFIMTTPNGDYVANTNPDHKRHYHRAELDSLLRSVFPVVEVRYAVRGGRYRKWGLKSWSLKHPVQTLLSMFGNFVNGIQSSDAKLNECAKGTHHLLACCQKIR
jgi:SAM-dependent methyltransferase